MKVVACVSQVPDTTTRVKIGTDRRSIDPAGVTYIINPYDEFAVEAAIQLKEKNGAETYVISIGKESSKEVIKKSYAMGIDKGILVKIDAELDSFAVAKNIADAIKDLNADIIFCGKQSVDFDDSQVGTLLGEFLGIPSISVVVDMKIEGNLLTAEREIEGGKEIVQATLPVVVCCQKGINEPRYPNLKGIMQSKSKPIEEKQPTFTESKTQIIEMHLPKAKGKGRVIGTDKSAVPELVRLLREEAKVI